MATGHSGKANKTHKKSAAKKTAERPQYVEQDTVVNEDWRLHAVTAVSRDSRAGAIEFKRGDVIKLPGTYRLHDGKAITVGAPNVNALLLDFAVRLDIETQDLLGEIQAEAKHPALTMATFPDRKIFDGFEKRMASAVFAFTAVESFANEIIEMAYGQGYRYEQKQKHGLVASLDIENVLWLTLDEKLGKVVADALNIKSPKQTIHWDNFKRLKRIRNRIIHIKGRDRANSTDRSFWEEMLRPKAANFGRQMYDLIGYVYEQAPHLRLRWHHKWPW